MQGAAGLVTKDNTEALERRGKRVAVCAGVTIALGALSVLGWTFKRQALASFGASYIPMAPSTAILLFMFGASLLALSRWRDQWRAALLAKAVSLTTFGIAIWMLVGFFGGTEIDIEGLLFRDNGRFGQVALGRMSPLTAICFILAAMALMLYKPNSRRRLNAAGGIVLAGSCIVATIVVGYTYGTPLLYGSPIIPMALTTAFGFLAAFSGFIFLIGREYFPWRAFSGTSARAQMLRAFLPASFFAILVHGLLFKLIASQFEMNLALLSVLSAFGFTLITTLFTLHIASALGTRIDEAEKAAAELSILKTEFINNMSHELRTPLNGVIGMSEVLMSEPLTESQAECIRTIHDSGHRLLRTVSDILCFSVAHSEKQLTLENSPFKLNDVIEKAVRTLQPLAALKRIAIKGEIAELVPLDLIGDGKNLTDVLIRLAENSVKFTSTGTITIAVCNEKDTENFVRLRFDVMDTGIGIPKELQKGIFSLFFQVDGSSLRKNGGLGIGLALCKTIVDAMGGTISYRSDSGKGAKFWFSLDVRKGTRAAVSSPQLNAGPPAKILIVEDDLTNQKVTRRLLEKIGYETELACDGKQAVKHFAAAKFDLILMDCQMPEMDGYEATSIMRKFELKTGAHVPIIALTAHVSLKEKEKCLVTGMDDFLCKPTEIGTLKNKIEYWLQKTG